MAKRYDPIMCMMVDEPTKAQDEILFYQLRFSSGRTEGAKLDESEIRSYAEALLEKYGEKQVAVSRQGKIVATYFNRKAQDSASALDEAIKTCDGMFQQIFGKYSSAAKQHYDRAVKELDSFKGEANDYLDIAGKWEKQLRNDLARIDEAYAVAGEDYNAARREIRAALDSLTQVMLRKAREKQK